MPTYSETHHLNSDDGGTNVHVALHLQGASLLRAMEFVDAVLATAGEFVLEAETPIPLPDLTPYRGATVLRPQTSGYCVHIDQATEDDPEEIQALGLACRHPGRMPLREDEQTQEWECPHLDTPEILCPVRDACYAMGEVARLRDACEAEQEEQDREMEGCGVPRSDYLLAPPAPPEPAADTGRLHTYAVEPEPERVPSHEATAVWGEIKSRYPEPDPTASPKTKRKDGWTAVEDEVLASAEGLHDAYREYAIAFPDSERTRAAIRKRYRKVTGDTTPATRGRGPAWSAEEDAVLARCTTPPEAVAAFREVFGPNSRTDAAISTRHWRVTKGQPAAASTPDFVGDTVPVTQCEEPSGKGFYGDTRALHADLMDGMMCDRPLSEGTIAVGDKVVRRNGPAGVGEVLFVGKGGMHVSVQFPGSIVSHVYGVGELRRVEE
ncbi:MAG: hypothetical protein WC277_06825 [Bacilli bacterium]